MISQVSLNVFCVVYSLSPSHSLSISSPPAENKSPPYACCPARFGRYTWDRCPPAFLTDGGVELGTRPGWTTWTWRPPTQVRVLTSAGRQVELQSSQTAYKLQNMLATCLMKLGIYYSMLDHVSYRLGRAYNLLKQVDKTCLHQY